MTLNVSKGLEFNHLDKDFSKNLLRINLDNFVRTLCKEVVWIQEQFIMIVFKKLPMESCLDYLYTILYANMSIYQSI